MLPAATIAACAGARHGRSRATGKTAGSAYRQEAAETRRCRGDRQRNDGHERTDRNDGDPGRRFDRPSDSARRQPPAARSPPARRHRRTPGNSRSCQPKPSSTAFRHTSDDNGVQPPRPRHAQHQEEPEIDQHLDRDRPDRSVEAEVLLAVPFARQEELREKMPDVVALVDEEASVQIEIHRLKQRDDAAASRNAADKAARSAARRIASRRWCARQWSRDTSRRK